MNQVAHPVCTRVNLVLVWFKGFFKFCSANPLLQVRRLLEYVLSDAKAEREFVEESHYSVLNLIEVSLDILKDIIDWYVL